MVALYWNFALCCSPTRKGFEMAKLAVVIDDTPPPLSGARAELARATEQLEAASRALEEALKPERRLSAVVAQLEAVEAELMALRAEDDRILGEWLASGGETSRPEPTAATLAAEVRLIGLRRDGDAARVAYPAAAAAVQRCGEEVGRLHPVRLRALWGCAAAEAECYASEVWYPAMCAAVAASAPLESLKAELLSIGRGVNPDPAAIGAAMEVDRIIRETRAAAAAPGDPAAGARLLQDLTDDPTATLGTKAP
jgi:hypothetical protein